jgi:hypothetical protein
MCWARVQFPKVKNVPLVPGPAELSEPGSRSLSQAPTHNAPLVLSLSRKDFFPVLLFSHLQGMAPSFPQSTSEGPLEKGGMLGLICPVAYAALPSAFSSPLPTA